MAVPTEAQQPDAQADEVTGRRLETVIIPHDYHDLEVERRAAEVKGPCIVKLH